MAPKEPRTTRLLLAALACAVAGLLLVFGEPSALAQGATARLTLPDGQAAPASRVTLSLSVARGGAAIYSADLTLAYNSAVLAAVRVDKGTLTTDWTLSSNLTQPGVVRIALAGAQPLSADGELLRLVFDVTGAVGSESSLTLTQADLNEGAVARTVVNGQLRVVTMRTFSRPLVVGWNLVSFDVTPISGTLPITHVQDVLASVGGQYDLVEYYDSTDAADPWKAYNPAAPAYANDLRALQVGRGYWVRMTSGATWTLTGTPIASLAIPLRAGWNLVGWPVSTVRTLPGALGGIAGKYLSVWGYAGDAADPPWRHYAPSAAPWANTLAQMGPGNGYWIEATQTCTLTVAQ